ERRVMAAQRNGQPIAGLEPVIDPAQLAAAQQAVAQVYVHEAMLGYIQRLAAETRSHAHVAYGVSPRGAVALLRPPQALAAVRGAAFVTPAHVKPLATRVFAHRIVAKPRSRVQGIDGLRVVEDVLQRVEVPLDYSPQG